MSTKENNTTTEEEDSGLKETDLLGTSFWENDAKGILEITRKDLLV